MPEKGLNFGFIGVGQCGGNIANEFSKLGYKAVAFNTSATDLGKLTHIPKNNLSLINIGVQGAGKNPEIGKRALEEHIEDVIRLIRQVFDPASMDMLFVCAGLGGGTGSGIAPLLAQILSEEGFAVGMIVTIPSDTESPKVKIVALNAFEELSQLQNIGTVFVVDNSKAVQLPTQMGFKTKYVIMNENIAMKLNDVNKMTVLPSEVAFDARDFQTLLASRGSGVISSITIEDISELNATETLAQYMNKALSESLYANTDFLQAKGCAFLFEFPEGGSLYLTEEALFKAQKEVGLPFEVFTGIYENKNRKRSAVMHVVVTGLPFPIKRLHEIQSQLEDQVSTIQARIEQSQTQTFSGNGKSLLDKFINPASSKPAQKPPGESTLDKLLKNKKI